MNDFNIENLEHLKVVLNQIIQEIISKVPESVRPDSVDINLDMDNVIIHFNLDIRGSSIIFGSRPHFPPVSAIKSWVERKNIQPHPDSKGRLPSINQLSFLIARKISVTGTPKHDYYDKATEEILAQYQTQIQEAFSEDIINLLGIQELL